MSEISNKFENCRAIQDGNITFIPSGLGVHGIPEHFMLNFICFLTIGVIFLFLKERAWKLQRENHLNIHEIGWIGLLYRDVYDFISKSDLSRVGSEYAPIDRTMSFTKMIRHSFFNISDEKILIRCGVDASQYLAFLKYSTHFLIINAIVCMGIILPTNLSGKEEPAGRSFERTTMTNLSVNSSLLWIHVAFSCFLLLICWFAVRAISLNLQVFNESRWTERTVIVRSIGKRILTSEAVENYFKKHYPKCLIEDVKLAYKYRRLLVLHRNLRNAEETLDLCYAIQNFESREVVVKEYCWFCYNICGCPTGQRNLKNGIDYYGTKVNMYKEALAQELNRLPRNTLPMAFVTFQKEHFAHQVLTPNIHFSSLSKEERWRISKAPEADNIIWENIREGNITLNIRTFFINIAVFIVAFFLTTPTIVISSFNVVPILEVASPNKNAVVQRFLLSALVWFLSSSIPALVTYSSHFLEFKTKSSMYVSLMRKTVTFLIFTIVILPSLGLTSLSAFTLWAVTNIEKSYNWNCIFLPDNGAFFAGYIITSAFIGVSIELIRIPDLLLCFYSLLMAKSEAERLSIRKAVLWDFSFGIQYSYTLLIFSLTVFFSIPCPLISLFGLMYFILKSVVDRYNIYFACTPSQISYKIHVLATKFIMITMLLKECGFFFLLYVRSGWISVTYAASCIMWLNVVICLTTINPCNWKFVPPCTMMPIDESVKCYRRRSLTQEEMEAYHPRALISYLPLIQNLDKYNNPIISDESISNVDISTNVHSQKSASKDDEENNIP